MDWKDKYEIYLRDYCHVHNITREEAETHAIVKITKQAYMTSNKKPQMGTWKEDKK